MARSKGAASGDESSQTGSEGDQTNGNPSPDVYKPDKPKFGGLNKIDRENWAAWTGGKPSNDLTGLEKPNPSYISEKQYHPTGISAQSKAQYYRVEGLRQILLLYANLINRQWQAAITLKDVSLAGGAHILSITLARAVDRNAPTRNT